MSNFIFSGLCKYAHTLNLAHTPYVFYTLLPTGFFFRKIASVGKDILFCNFRTCVGCSELQMCMAFSVDYCPLYNCQHIPNFAFMDIKFKFGQKVKELRLKKGLSQEAFAHLAELDRTYISSIEKGDRNVSITVIEKIATALDMEITKLFEWKKE